MAKKIRVESAPIPRSVEQRERTCTGKIRYKKLRLAKSEARRLYDSGILDPLTVYRCPFCTGWHVGKATKTILARLRVVEPA